MIESHKELLGGLRELDNLYGERNFPAVMKLARRLLERYPGVVPLLVVKALAIAQLDETSVDEARPGEAEEALRLAISVDSWSARTMNELGFHLWSWKDDSKEALELFDRSIQVCLDCLRRAYIGRIECLMDLASLEGVSSEDHADKRRTAGATLTVARTIFPDDQELQRIAAHYKLEK